MLDPGLTRFVESATGGRVARAERAATGASRATWLVDVESGGAKRALVLRHDTGDGPMSGTPLCLAREAVVYGALAATPVRIPRLIAVHDGGDALLVERAPGSEAFGSVGDEAQKQALVADYFEALAELHCVDPEKLELPGFARPADPREHTRADLSLWRDIGASRLSPPDALLEFAGGWLDANAPDRATRTSLCHGDAGPGNFLFEGPRVTALLDWEFAHLGDPQDDLAWVAVRAQLLGGFGDLAAGYRVWSAATGLRVDLARVEYYRALVLLRMAISCCVALSHSREACLDHAGAREMETTVYEMLLPYLRALLPQALSRAGCAAGELPGFADAGRAAVEANPVLRAHARPLDPLPAG